MLRRTPGGALAVKAIVLVVGLAFMLAEARRRPVHTGLSAGSGIVALLVGIYLTTRYELVDRVLVLIGLG